MIDKKMKHVQEWTALPIGVSATAAVGQGQASRDEKKTTVDISQYDNLTMNLQNVEEAEAKYVASLQQVGERESAAKQMLALDDGPLDERRRAEGLLFKCAEERADLGQALGRVRRLIEVLKAQMAPMEAEVDRQRKIRAVAAGLR